MHDVDRSGRGVNIPVLAGAGFVVASLVTYWFWWADNPDGLVAVYVVVCVLALLVGSYIGNTLSLRPSVPAKIGLHWLWIACLALIFTATVNISGYYQSFGEIAQFVLEPGDAYERVKFLNRNDLVTPTGISETLGPVASVLAFTKYVVFGWSVLFWSVMPRSLKVTSLVSMFFYAIQAVLIGAMVNVGTVLLSTMVVLIVKERRRIKVTNVRFLFRAAVLASFGLAVLSYFLGSRGAAGAGIVSRIVAGADGLLFYIAHGFTGLGYALRLPFEWTGGQTIFYGFSRLFIGGVPPDSYLARAEDASAWSSTQLWSTAIPWLASDITFVGVPFLLVAVGFWSGRLWIESCATLDPFAVLLLGQLTIAIFFFPANNHLLQTFPNAIGFLLIFLAYLLSRQRSRAGVTDYRRRAVGSVTEAD